MLFEMNSKLKEHYLEMHYDETTHGIITRDKWWEIFNEVRCVVLLVHAHRIRFLEEGYGSRGEGKDVKWDELST